MANIKTANGKGKYHDSDAKEDVIKYVLNQNKTPHGYIGGYNIDMSDPVGSMQSVSLGFGKEKGVQIHHLIISFNKNELTDYNVANQIANRLSQYVGQRYQTVYAVHENTDHIHFHLLFNSVSYLDGSKYYGRLEDFKPIEAYARKLLREVGINQFYYIKNKQ